MKHNSENQTYPFNRKVKNSILSAFVTLFSLGSMIGCDPAGYRVATMNKEIEPRTKEYMRIRHEKRKQVRRLIASHRYDDARNQIQQLRAEEPGDPLLAIVALKLYEEAPDIDGEIHEFEILYGNNSENINGPMASDWLCRYGDDLLKRGFTDRARLAFFQATRCIPLGHLKPEFETVEEYGPLHRLQSAAYTNAAMRLSNAPSNGKWLVWLEKALDANPENREAQAYKAERLASLGRLAESKAILDRLGPIESNSPRHRVWMRFAADTLSRHGKRSESYKANTGITFPYYHHP